MSKVGYVWLPSRVKDYPDMLDDLHSYMQECVPYESEEVAHTEKEQDYDTQYKLFGYEGPMMLVKVSLEVIADDYSDPGDCVDYDQFDDSYINLSKGY
jgi:hypothetical protein